jgi:hypothetical protein
MPDTASSLRILRGHEVERLTGVGEGARNRMEAGPVPASGEDH